MGIRDTDLEDFSGLGFAQTAFSSPGMPAVYDVAGGSLSSANTIGTVSPQDLFMHDPFMSAPNSTALTALTSPSTYNGSPEFHDSFNMSPPLGGSDFDNGSNDPWFPLFPQEALPDVSTTAFDPETCPQDEEPETVKLDNAQKKRKARGQSESPADHSPASGVGCRRREKPLPPIVVEDPSDVVAMKRARNTLAARKSRERKAQRVEELEERIAKLERERDYWKNMAELGSAP